jgi:L-aspartate oxidase
MSEAVWRRGRIAAAIEADQPTRRVVTEADIDSKDEQRSLVVTNAIRRQLQQKMDVDAGVLRSAESLDKAAQWIDAALTGDGNRGMPCTEDWETTNLMTVARVLVVHAKLREETRGSHWREDHPDTEERWRVRLVTTMAKDGVLHTEHRSPEWVPGIETT